MKQSIIKEYVEHILFELRKDEKFINLMKNVMHPPDAVLKKWTVNIEEKLGRSLTNIERNIARDIATKKWPEIRKRASNKKYAEQSLFNVLNRTILYSVEESLGM